MQRTVADRSSGLASKWWGGAIVAVDGSSVDGIGITLPDPSSSNSGGCVYYSAPRPEDGQGSYELGDCEERRPFVVENSDCFECDTCAENWYNLVGG